MPHTWPGDMVDPRVRALDAHMTDLDISHQKEEEEDHHDEDQKQNLHHQKPHVITLPYHHRVLPPNHPHTLALSRLQSRLSAFASSNNPQQQGPHYSLFSQKFLLQQVFEATPPRTPSFELWRDSLLRPWVQGFVSRGGRDIYSSSSSSASSSSSSSSSEGEGEGIISVDDVIPPRELTKNWGGWCWLLRCQCRLEVKRLEMEECEKGVREAEEEMMIMMMMGIGMGKEMRMWGREEEEGEL